MGSVRQPKRELIDRRSSFAEPPVRLRLLARNGGVEAGGFQSIIRLSNSSLDPDGSTTPAGATASPAPGAGEIWTALNGAPADSASHEVNANIMIWPLLQ